MMKSTLVVRINNDLDWDLFDQSKLAMGTIFLKDIICFQIIGASVLVKSPNSYFKMERGIVIWPVGGRPVMNSTKPNQRIEVLVKKIILTKPQSKYDGPSYFIN
ncbi:hypothetical protein [Marinigracilibium pacificum]|uniref:Uncharacterized protein n=1 Tax=Marinigracilibium pacificum TaxID=2729599 RepID=A0A848JBD1_9BACT|nr:hypothetical protein [Marinigracilibium pacificum]NMM50332.1 hypothetical protein [Marinigracilibium pacificum]